MPDLDFKARAWLWLVHIGPARRDPYIPPRPETLVEYWNRIGEQAFDTTERVRGNWQRLLSLE